MGLPAINYESQLQTKTCPVCFIVYAAPALLFEKKMEKGGDWYCPNGHSLIFTETEVDKLKKKLAAEQSRVEMYRRENQEKERSIRALKGKITKTKNRIAHGVCPCCNRSFQNVARHMKTKHPDYTGESK